MRVTPDRRRMHILLPLLLAAAAGCGTTRVTDTTRTATEQLLVSNAIDRSVAQFDFRHLTGKPVFFDAQYLDGCVDKGYVVSSIRQQLLANGCILMEDRAKATFVVEVRSGGVGTDRHQLLFGVPQMNLPALLPGMPSLIPEIPFAKRTDQKAIAKLAVFAYDRTTGRPAWQSGVVENASTSIDTWVFGAGPFRRGTIGEDLQIAGKQVSIPFLMGKEEGGAAPPAAVTQPAVFLETLPPHPLSGPSGGGR